MNYNNGGYRGNYKINEEDVPESKHTIFVRGLPAHLTYDNIKDFFEDKVGPCSFDFQKVNQDRNILFVAIRFETREAAKEAYHRYKEEKEDVLGHRCEVTWFRDIRRFVQYQTQKGTLSKYANRNTNNQRERFYRGNNDRFRDRRDVRRYSAERTGEGGRGRSASRSSRGSRSLSESSTRSSRSRSRKHRSKSRSSSPGGRREREKEGKGNERAISSDEEKMNRKRKSAQRESRGKEKRTRRSYSSSQEDSAEEGEVQSSHRDGSPVNDTIETTTSASASTTTVDKEEQPVVQTKSAAFSPVRSFSATSPHSGSMRITLTTNSMTVGAASKAAETAPGAAMAPRPQPPAVVPQAALAPPPPPPVIVNHQVSATSFKVQLDSDDPPQVFRRLRTPTEEELKKAAEDSMKKGTPSSSHGSWRPVGENREEPKVALDAAVALPTPKAKVAAVPQPPVAVPPQASSPPEALSATPSLPTAPRVQAPPPPRAPPPVRPSPMEQAVTTLTAPPKVPPSTLKPPLIKDGNGPQVRPFADLKKHQDDAMLMVKIDEETQVPESLQLSSLTLGGCAAEEELRMQERLRRMAAITDPAGKTRFEMRRRQLEMKYRNDCQAFGVVTSKLLQKNHELEDFLKQALLESLEDLERTLLNEVDNLLTQNGV